MPVAEADYEEELSRLLDRIGREVRVWRPPGGMAARIVTIVAQEQRRAVSRGRFRDRCPASAS
jgi:hypothetical protein